MGETSKQQRFSLYEAVCSLVSDAVTNVSRERLNKGVILVGERNRLLVEMAFREAGVPTKHIDHLNGDDLSQRYVVKLREYFDVYHLPN